MHHADWDGVKAVPLTLLTSGLIILTIYLPPLGLSLGVIMIGIIGIACLINFLKNQKKRRDFQSHCLEVRCDQDMKNALPTYEAERASSMEKQMADWNNGLKATPEYQEILHSAKARTYLYDTD